MYSEIVHNNIYCIPITSQSSMLLNDSEGELGKIVGSFYYVPYSQSQSPLQSTQLACIYEDKLYKTYLLHFCCCHLCTSTERAGELVIEGQILYLILMPCSREQKKTRLPLPIFYMHIIRLCLFASYSFVRLFLFMLLPSISCAVCCCMKNIKMLYLYNMILL